MKLYAIDVTIHATAYVKAETRSKANQKAVAAFKNRQIDVSDVNGGLISGLRYDDPALPEISLAPAMTLGEVASEEETWRV